MKERHDDGRDKGRAEGIAIGEKRGVKIGEKKGRAAEKIETARNMMKNGLSSDLIIKCTGISEQQMKGLL